MKQSHSTGNWCVQKYMVLTRGDILALKLRSVVIFSIVINYISLNTDINRLYSCFTYKCKNPNLPLLYYSSVVIWRHIL